MNKEYIEVWKDIQGYEGVYQVSNMGRVKSLKFGKERIMKPRKDKDGYYQLGLSKNGKTIHFRVHRLVAITFLPNLNNYPIINHKDENPSNNKVSNLEWCTHQYNNNYGSAIKKRITKENIEKCAKAHQKPIACYNKNGDLVALYTSIKQASELLNINNSCICTNLKGKIKSTHGYIFKYIKKAS